jgi:hypothetical protein
MLVAVVDQHIKLLRREQAALAVAATLHLMVMALRVQPTQEEAVVVGNTVEALVVQVGLGL